MGLGGVRGPLREGSNATASRGESSLLAHTEASKARVATVEEKSVAADLRVMVAEARAEATDARVVDLANS